MNAANDWNAELYDGKHAFVSKLGKGVIDLLQPQAGERILDLGCGTGDLAREIADSGAQVTGMDFSLAMIEKARSKYPDIAFIVENAENFRTEEPFDAVFSNAALHWMKNADAVAKTVWHALRPGGRFVAEFGGKGNISNICRAIDVVLRNAGIDAQKRNPWYYPSIGEYAGLLERQGFRVAFAALLDRPTPLNDGDIGMRNWLNTFAGPFFAGFDERERAAFYEKIEQQLKPVLFRDGGWFADYVRIRIAAEKR